jgi:glycosyltransferase involved in cell wall biosynthesis
MHSTQKVKLGFWSPLVFESGGTETWHKTLWKHLGRERVEIVGMAVLDPDEYRVPVADELRKIAPVDVGPDALHSLSLNVDVLVMWGIAHPGDYLERRPGLRTIFVCHGCAASRWSCDIVKAAHKSGVIDQFVGVSTAALGPIVAAGVHDAIVIRNGLDLDRFNPAAYERGPSNGSRILGYVGRLSREKRPELLIETIAALPDNWSGRFVGKDYLDGRMQKLAQLRCPSRIDFRGQSDDVGKELSDMDALLVPSETEGFGYQIAEAWAMGVPVVSTPVGIALEHPDLVQMLPKFPTGIHCARAVLMTLGNELTLATRIQKARQTVDRFYSGAEFGRWWTDAICKMAENTK